MDRSARLRWRSSSKRSELFKSRMFRRPSLKKFTRRKSKNLLTRSGLNSTRTTQVSSQSLKWRVSLLCTSPRWERVTDFQRNNSTPCLTRLTLIMTARSTRKRWRPSLKRLELPKSLMSKKLSLRSFTKRRRRSWSMRFGLNMTRITQDSCPRLRWSSLSRLISINSVKETDYPRSSSTQCSHKLTRTTMVRSAKLRWRSKLIRSELLRSLTFNRLSLMRFTRKKWRN